MSCQQDSALHGNNYNFLSASVRPRLVSQKMIMAWFWCETNNITYFSEWILWTVDQKVSNPIHTWNSSGLQMGGSNRENIYLSMTRLILGTETASAKLLTLTHISQLRILSVPKNNEWNPITCLFAHFESSKKTSNWSGKDKNVAVWTLDK